MLLSLDLSTKSTGYAIFDGKNLIKYDCIKASGNDMIGRIKKIIHEIDILLMRFPIDEVIIEEVRIEQGVQSKTYRALMYMQAALMFLLHENYPKIKINTIYPNSWRTKCGIKTGRRKREELKKDDIKFVNTTYGINITNDDIADAIAIGHSLINELSNEMDWT